MPLLKYNGIGITAVVQENKIKNRNFTKHFEQSVVIDIVDKTGVERRVGGYSIASF